MIIFYSIFAIYISYCDLKSHRIPNRALMIFAACSFSIQIMHSRFDKGHLALALVFLIASLLLSFTADMGAGDVKLLTLCALTIIPPTRTGIMAFMLTLLLSISIHLAIHYRLKKTISGYLPLAPSILLSAIWSASGA